MDDDAAAEHLNASVLLLGDFLSWTLQPLVNHVELTRDAVREVVRSLYDVRDPGLTPAQWAEVTSLSARLDALEAADEAADETAVDGIGLALFRIAFAAVAATALAEPLASLVPSMWPARGGRTLEAAIGAAAAAATSEMLKPVQAGVERRRWARHVSCRNPTPPDPGDPGQHRNG